MAMGEGLTRKQKAFAEEYVSNGYNATQAYLTAYGCSYSTAARAYWKVKNHPKVKEYITELQKEQFEAACINAERIGLKLAEIAFAERGDDYYCATSQLKALDLLQKQLGLQKQHIDADVKTEINISIGGDENVCEE